MIKTVMEREREREREREMNIQIDTSQYYQNLFRSFQREEDKILNTSFN
jgi:hypothetical protein